jgi:hypothetical protein
MDQKTEAPKIPALTPTSSSQIRGIGFDGGALYLMFNGSKVYRYTGPKVEQHYNDLLAAESMGRHFGAHVRHCKETTCEPLGVFEQQADKAGDLLPVIDAPAAVRGD